MYHGTPAERAELRQIAMLRLDPKPKTTVSPKAGKKVTRITKSTKTSTRRTQKLRNRGSKPTTEQTK